ncbi:BING4CT (NUC141) domain-containing protein [Cardiosporidium cionae]|uniref:BING4CT (NUC141) domain-containing protein n=1 Tax=Cardiosporidium cionae TaxID=476202 RepID=A0ABQ7JG97_9APIC|nr:BING4CT (NUC141) domain-containing protein [Cardiosporidium cionae]|eukprot:KAF8823018.1 BING4CT (NUC141) domain-containing protein [Cardiosporidium cionae]
MLPAYAYIQQIGNKKLRHRLSLQQKLNEEAVRRLAVSEVLLPSNEGFLETDGLEKSYRFSQADILSNLDVGYSKKVFDLQLSYGPYSVDFSTNGRYLLFGGTSGNFSLLDCHNYNALTDVNVQETVRAVKFLHDHSMFAVAQKKYVYIYDHSGLELHCMRDNMLSYCLDFLPFHFLLTSIGEFGELSYDDVSMGKVIAKHKTQRGPCHCMRQNPNNAVIHLGHSRGTVTLWTPNLSKPAVDLLCHKGPVTCLDMFQNYMVTAGVDGFWKVWDMRTYKCLHTFNYFGTPPSSIDASQTGLIGIGFGPHVQVWKDAFSLAKPKMPYMTQDYFAEQVKSVRFRPFEDICCVGRSDGLSTIVIPGSGLANFDSFAADPFETPKERREHEIHRLLEKLQPEMITLQPESIGTVDNAPTAIKQAEKLHEVLTGLEAFVYAALLSEEEALMNKKKKKRKNKMRGRGNAEALRKSVVIKQSKGMREKAKTRNDKQGEKVTHNAVIDFNKKSLGAFSALDRFRKKEKVLQ